MSTYSQERKKHTYTLEVDTYLSPPFTDRGALDVVIGESLFQAEAALYAIEFMSLEAAMNGDIDSVDQHNWVIHRLAQIGKFLTANCWKSFQGYEEIVSRERVGETIESLTAVDFSVRKLGGPGKYEQMAVGIIDAAEKLDNLIDKAVDNMQSTK